MAHHGDLDEGLARLFDGGDDPLTQQLRDMQAKLAESYPDGTRLGNDDQGGLAIAIANVRDQVAIVFPKPVAWTAFPPETARELAQMLLDRAEEVDGIEARVRRVA